jgi:ABC-type cobalamin/Fe3+-siderophores transport system ATPase subunit
MIGEDGGVSEVVLGLEGVAQGFRRGRSRWRVLKGVSFTVVAGEFVGLLGGRGEGKTTLLRIAAGVDKPEDGKVWFEGRDLAACSADERAAPLGDRIVWMPRANFGGFDALRYIAMPLATGSVGMRAAEERATAALKRVGAEGCAECQWGDLSDWDRVLVTLARGYASRPRLIVVDDLLDALGVGGTRQAGELLLSIVRELRCGVLAGASDLGALLVADRVLRFDGEGGLSGAAEPSQPTNLRDFPGTAQAS